MWSGLEREQRAYILGEVWPETPNPALRGRTPVQAARAGDAETVLRAAIRLGWRPPTRTRAGCSIGTRSARG